MTDNEKKLFFALWPDDITRSEIEGAFHSNCFAKYTGKNFYSKNLHITLCFVGNVPLYKINCIKHAADKIKFKPFELTLNKFNIFRKAKIFYLGMMSFPDELMNIQKALSECLTHCDCYAELRDFTPHMTLKRKIKISEMSDLLAEKSPEILWRVNRFALVESISVEGGVVYKPIQFFNSIRV